MDVVLGRQASGNGAAGALRLLSAELHHTSAKVQNNQPFDAALHTSCQNLRIGVGQAILCARYNEFSEASV